MRISYLQCSSILIKFAIPASIPFLRWHTQSTSPQIPEPLSLDRKIKIFLPPYNEAPVFDSLTSLVDFLYQLQIGSFNTIHNLPHLTLLSSFLSIRNIRYFFLLCEIPAFNILQWSSDSPYQTALPPSIPHAAYPTSNLLMQKTTSSSSVTTPPRFPTDSEPRSYICN